MSDYAEDARREKQLEYEEAIHQARHDYCYNDCEYHTPECPYFVLEDEEENEGYFEFDECFKDSGGWE
jgi:uncharacterized protein YutD